MGSGSETATVDDDVGAREYDRLWAASHALLFGGPPPAARSVGRLRLLRRLGAGGMGVVYAAHDPDLEREVAVKLLHARPMAGTPAEQVRQRWLREARALARVAHPNVVHVYEVGVVDGEAYIAMELVEGRTLRGLSVGSEYTREEVLDVYLQAARGLAAAHAAGLVHRDFKPDNVLVGPDGRARVVDFGIARRVDVPTRDEEDDTPGTDDRVTRAGAVSGTPSYMPPEQRSGEAIDARSDQYAFCVSLFEALNGRRPAGPWGEVAESAPVAGPIRVFERGLARRPADRWPSMGELIDALERHRSAPVRRRRVALVGALVVVAGGGALAIRTPPQTACDETAAALDTAWNDARAAALERTIRERAPNFGETASASVRRTFDELATQWRAQHEQTCADETDATERAAVLHCLEGHAQELDATARVIEQADAKRLQRLDEVLALASVGDCADARRRRQVMALPEDPSARNEVQALRVAIADAGRLGKLGDPQAGLDALEAIAPRVEAADFGPVKAELLLTRGTLLPEVGDLAGGLEATEQGIAAAKGAALPLLEARGLATLGTIVGYHQRRAREGHRALDQARAALESAGGDAKLEITIEGHRGHVFLGAGAYEEALAAYRHALQLERARASASVMQGRLLEYIGVVQRRQGRYDEATTALDQSLAILQEELGAEHPRTLGIESSIANNLLKSGDTEAALVRLEALAKTTQARDVEMAPIVLSNLAQAYALLERYEDAVRTAGDAVEIFEARDEQSTNHARALSHRSRSRRLLGDHDGALQDAHAAVAIVERGPGPDHHEIVPILLKRAGAHLALGSLDRADDDLRRARAIAEGVGNDGLARDASSMQEAVRTRRNASDDAAKKSDDGPDRPADTGD